MLPALTACETLFKCTLPAGRSVHGFADAAGQRHWPLPVRQPSGWQPGAWKGPALGPLIPHKSGLHLAPAALLVTWLHAEIYQAEPGPDIATATDCVVARHARLLRRLTLPASVWAGLALAQARLALDVFVALVYPWDMVQRLQSALALAEELSALQQAHPRYRQPPATAARTWQQAQALVDHCQADACSGFSTNLNVEAAGHAARAVSLLAGLAYPDGPDYGHTDNWCIVKAQAAALMRALSGLVEDLQLKHADRFTPALVPPVAQPFLVRHPEYPLLHHAVRFAAMQHCNHQLLRALEDHNP